MNFYYLGNNLSCVLPLVKQVLTVIEISIMYEPARILVLLEERMSELGLSQTQLGQLAFGKANNSAIQALKAGSSPAVDRLEAIAKAIGWEVYFGPPRTLALQEPPGADDLAKPEGLRAGYLPIPWHGLARRKHRPPLCFDEAWLKRLSDTTNDLAMVEPGRSYLNLDARELVALIDTSSLPRREAETWAFVERGTAAIGVIQNERQALVIHGPRQGDAMRLVTDKEREAIPLLGRVLWLGTVAAGKTG